MPCARTALYALAAADGLSFLTVGDWGGAALEEPSKPYAKNVKDVAAQMGKTAAEKNIKFVVNTGDNFYWCGIENTTDFQVAKDWIDTYNAASLQVPWYGTLGNHEYGYNVEAQIELTKLHQNWIIDARYYSRRVQLDGSNYATLIFLDTSPCVQEYRSSDAKGWDPCGTQYPTCSLSGGKDPFEGQCHFNANILTQDCTTQYTWFKAELAKVPKDDWLIIVGHHPADEMDVEDMTTAMQDHGFDLYLNGHAHVLTQYQVDRKGAYVTSGAGALVLSDDQLGGTPGKDRTMHKVQGTGLEVLADGSLQAFGHSYEQVFNAKVSGFTLHTFSDDYKTLTTDFLDTTGKTLHSFTVTKGASPSPGPSPGPPSPSPSPGKCCYYKDSDCPLGATCCDGEGHSYSRSSCTHWGSKHHCVWKDDHCEVGPGADGVVV